MTDLDVEALRGSLSQAASAGLDALDVFAEIDSTNTYLKAQTPPKLRRMRVVIADHQTAGRGRHDREWLSKPGGSLCLSIAYTFGQRPANLPALTLALGVGAATVLTELGVPEPRLKWPNDILLSGSKLGGILTESQTRSGDNISVVAGIGINVCLPQLRERASERSWAHSATDLASHMSEPPQRQHLSVALIEGLYRTLQSYDSGGADGFMAAYQSLDGLFGRTVVVETGAEVLHGIASGIDEAGALLVKTAEGERRVISGSIQRFGQAA